MTSDKAGLERKFEVKERNRNKPGVKLWQMDELLRLAQLNPEIQPSTKHWDECYSPIVSFLGNQKLLKNSKAYGDGREELMTDGTSRFVIKFGKAGEQLAAKL